MPSPFPCSQPTGGTAFWSETQSVSVTDGLFNVLLGSTLALDPDDFTGATWLGIKVGGDNEMTPRQRVVSVGYALQTSHADTATNATMVGGKTVDNLIPSGMVAFFASTTCPAGWSPATDVEGRVVVGLADGGTLGQTVGSALAAGGNRTITEVPAHTHTIDPPATTSSTAPSHTHDVNPAPVSSGAESAHTHTVDPPAASTSSNGNHNHTYATLQADGTNGFTNGPGGVWVHRELDTSTEGAHTHSVNITAFTSGQGSSHAHTVDVGNTTSTAAGAHSHTTDVAAFSSGSTGATSVDVTMPYIQLLACQKD